MEAYAAELLALHAGSLELEAQLEERGGLEVGAKSTNGLVEHVGEKVFVERNTMGVDRDSTTSPPTVTRKESRDVARHAIGLLGVCKRVAVVGHPGIGKTRGSLAYTLQELLWRGEVVMRVGYKNNMVYAFVPDEHGTYRVWRHTPARQWDMSVLAADPRAFVLIDPPEGEGGYEHSCNARMIKYVSNNHDRHYRNFDKDGKIIFTSMPKEEEMVAMIPALWTEDTLFPGQCADSAEDKEAEVRRRCRLVGCAPRRVFSAKLFTLQLRSMLTGTKALVHEVTWGELGEYLAGKFCGKDGAVGSVSSKHFFLKKASDDRWEVEAILSPVATVLLRDGLKEHIRRHDNKTAFQFETMIPTLLQMADEPGWARHVRPATQADTSRAIRSLPATTTDTVVVASTNYPVLDFATSPTDWFNAKVGDNKPKVGASAFVTVLLELGLASKEGGKLVMKDSETRINCTILRPDDADKLSTDSDGLLEFDLENTLNTGKHRDLDYDQVETVFKRHVQGKALDISAAFDKYVEDIIGQWDYYNQKAQLEHLT